MYSYQLSKKRIEEFLDNGLGKNQSNKNSYKNILLKVRESENYYDTYIYNFSRDQYCNFLKALKIPSILSIPPYVTYIKDYVKWCKEEGYCNDIETILNVQKQEYKTFVYNKAIYFKNREDVYRRLKKVNNPQEKVIVILLFEGISGGKAEDIFKK